MDMVEKTQAQLVALFPKSQVEAEGEQDQEQPRQDGVLATLFTERGACLDVQCAPERIQEVVQVLDTCGWVIESISGVDWPREECFTVLYDFIRYDTSDARTVVRVRIPRQTPVVPSISSIYPGANWHERETHDFFGIVFAGHPNLEPLLLPEDADFHPLRKDFKP
jgi:NADH-quinone oxidoreductase subunit C